MAAVLKSASWTLDLVDISRREQTFHSKSHVIIVLNLQYFADRCLYPCSVVLSEPHVIEYIRSYIENSSLLEQSRSTAMGIQYTSSAKTVDPFGTIPQGIFDTFSSVEA
jgi:hypothetical protein